MQGRENAQGEVSVSSDEPSADRIRLENLLGGAPGAGEVWRPEEFAALFRHQLTAPLRADLAALDPRLAEKLAGLRAPDGGPVVTFGDLLSHPAPPVVLLELVKEFAKESRRPGGGHLPPEVATLLYYLAIATALLRCGRPLTRLDGAALREGFQWAVAQPWADEATRELFRQAEGRL